MNDVTEQVNSFLKKEFDIRRNVPGRFVKRGKKIWLISRELTGLEKKKLNVEHPGIYFARHKDGFRLTTEGSFVVGQYARRNVYELSSDEFRAWISGQELPPLPTTGTYVLVHRDRDFLGVGKVTKTKTMNFVRKTRRIPF